MIDDFRRGARASAPPGGFSSVTFGDEGVVSRNAVPERVGRVSAAKLAEGAGNAIFGGEAPSARARTAEPGVGTRRATWDDVKAMMIADLRTTCRQNGLNPAGSRETLAERVWEAVQRGECALEVEDKRACGVTSGAMNNYTRSSGQNTDNFLTSRATSRVLRDPGGGSSFIFGGESPPKRSGNDEGERPSRGGSPGNSAARASAIAAMSGSDIFGNPPPRQAKISAAKLAEHRGNNVFDQTLPPRGPLPAHRQAALKQIQGGNIFDPTLPEFRRQRSGVSQTPGGASSISFEGMFLPASDDEGDDIERELNRAVNEPVIEEPEDSSDA